jgi:hypothetical protein
MEKCGNGTNKYCRFPTLDFRLALNGPQRQPQALHQCIFNVRSYNIFPKNHFFAGNRAGRKTLAARCRNDK